MLLFLDGSEHYDDGHIASKYTTVRVAEVATGRHGQGINEGHDVTMGFTSDSGKVIIGSAVKCVQSLHNLYAIGDGGQAASSNNMFWLDRTPDGAITAYAFGGDSDASVADVLKSQRWHFLEAQFDIQANATGEGIHNYTCDINVWVDGILVLTTSLATENLVNPATPIGWTWIRRGGDTTYAGPMTDDCYICDGDGDAPWNDPVGDIEIGAIYPNGEGDASDFAPTGAANNWDCTNDRPPDDDTTYALGNSTGDEDLHEMENIDTDDTILGVQMLVLAKHSGDGFVELTPLMKQDGVVYDQVTRSIGSTYEYRNRDVFEKAPDGSDWTDAIINAIQAGYRWTP